MTFRVDVVGRPPFLSSACDPKVVVEHLLEYVSYAFSVLGLQQATIASHLSAVKFFHRLTSAMELEIRHPLIVNALKGAGRVHAGFGAKQRVRRPVSLGVLRQGSGLAALWGRGGRVLYLGLCAAFFFLARGGEMFGGSPSDPSDHILRRGDVAFFRGDEQLPFERAREADRVEVRFRSAKGDQLGLGKVMTRVRTGPPRRVEAGGGAVDVMIELLSLFPSLPSHAPLVSFCSESSAWSVWSKKQATDALRQIVALAGMPPEEFALHSLRIGGATFLAAGGASPELLRSEGRWAGEQGFRPYVRNHGMDAEWVSDVLASMSTTARQPGQGTQWGDV